MKYLLLLTVWIAFASHGKTPDALVIALNDWSSQRVLSRVTGKLLQRMDIPVEFQDIKTKDQWGGLKSGFVHLQIEIWQSSTLSSWSPLVNSGHVLDLGEHQAKTREEWWYPEHVEAMCPGLPDWQALKHCSAIFKTPVSGDKGVYVTGPWLYKDADRIRALGLNFTIERLKDDKAMWKRLDTAVKQKNLFYYSTGHRIGSKHATQESS